jgi:diaminopimelate decarboxylase
MTVPPHVLAHALCVDDPVYVYDLAVLRQRLARLEALPIRRKRIHFATMANDNPQVLSEIAAAGHGVFVNSARHLALALSAGFEPGRVIFASSNMTAAEMRHCHNCGVHLVLDSLAQVETFDGLASPGTAVGVRVNVGSAIDNPEIGDEPSYRFGLLPAELKTAVERVRRLRICGVHSYFGTDIMAPATLAEGLRRLARVAASLSDLSYVDSGGGLGVPEDPDAPEFDLDAYGRVVAAELAELESRLGRPIELVIEPGRWLVAPIGWFFARVVDIKRRPDRIFAGTSASVAQFPRPLVYPERARHACEIVTCERPRALADRPVWLSGNSTYSRDFLARAVTLPEPEIGDLIAFHHAGAYCRSMVTRFLGKEMPAEITLNATIGENARPEQAALLSVAE